MSKVIYKYPLRVVDSQLVLMPTGAKILSVQAQNGTLCMWAVVDEMPENQSNVSVEYRTFYIFGTGNSIPAGMPTHVVSDHKYFIGTVQMDGFVWHVFEVPNK